VINIKKLVFYCLIAFLFFWLADLPDYVTIYTVIFISVVFGYGLCMFFCIKNFKGILND